MQKRETDYMATHERGDENVNINIQTTYSQKIREQYLEDTLNIIENNNNFYRFFESYGERLKRIQS